EEERKIKMIWDFRGPDAARIAQHHVVHLKEYIKSQDMKLNICGVEEINPAHHIAFMVAYENEVPPVRTALKPHRGQIYKE
ncbi:MAG TPA: hypothetical protein VFM59_07890, partial [Salinimicrobium sp.]|nr:hypothetical protein [Salinimicrobium sp.]